MKRVPLALLLMALPLLLLVPSPLAAGPPTARSLPGLMPAPELVLRHAAEIGLDPGQRSRLDAAMTELEPAAQQATVRLHEESDALARLLAQEKPDEPQVTAQFEKVLAAEDEVKRMRLKMSLRARSVLSMEQLHKLEALPAGGPARRTASPEQQELAASMTRVRDLIERAKAEGRDLGNVREMWKRVSQATQEGKTAEACRILDETAASLAVQPKPAPNLDPAAPR